MFPFNKTGISSKDFTQIVPVTYPKLNPHPQITFHGHNLTSTEIHISSSFYLWHILTHPKVTTPKNTSHIIHKK